MKNQGELPKYFVEQSHEAIISADLFEKVQELVKERTEQFSHPSATNRYPLSGMVQMCNRKAQHLQVRGSLDVQPTLDKENHTALRQAKFRNGFCMKRFALLAN